MAYIDQGAGTPILLVHGFPLDHTMWNPQIDALSTRARVIAPDLRGFGASPLGDVDVSRGITMEQFADDLVQLLDALAIREPVVLIGLSMGGYIAWPFVRKYPDRVRGLAQLDTRAVADSEEARTGRLKVADTVAETGSGRVAEMMEPKLFAHEAFAKQPEVVRAIRQVMERTPPAAIAAAQRGMAARPDVTAWLPSIKLPTLILVGEHDAISPAAEMKAIADAIPDAEFAVIPDVGHMTTVEAPDAVNATVIRFLDRLNSHRG